MYKLINYCKSQVTKQILDGDGIGWLKLSRFKKLMEEEGYRNLVVSKLNRTLDNKISPSDHIDDVVIIEYVFIIHCFIDINI